jgi:hypothetical protein
MSIPAFGGRTRGLVFVYYQSYIFLNTFGCYIGLLQIFRDEPVRTTDDFN